MIEAENTLTRMKLGAPLAESDVRAIEKVLAEVRELRHHKTTTTGLWATDKPEEVEDPKGLLFQL